MTIVWFRNDLRLHDNPAFYEAVKSGDRIIPLFVWSPEEEGRWEPGAASKWWLHHALFSLKEDLEKHGLYLVVRHDQALLSIRGLIEKNQARKVVWNRRYEPQIIARDTKVKAALKEEGIECQSYNSQLLFEPWTVLNREEKPFQVFTPFWKACLASPDPAPPLPLPPIQRDQGVRIPSVAIEELGLLPRIRWESGLAKTWHPGEKGAQKAVEHFAAHWEGYGVQRDFPGLEGTSRLSAYLHFGEISSRTLWHRFSSAEGFLRQLGWREFAHHLLFHFPEIPDHPLRPAFASFPWDPNKGHLHAWQKGMTGYPIVDAGMRQLWQTGWMHNRVRMIVGSFLVKDLLISWQEGAKWFWDTLVDADLANNTLGWQWIGGCGADAAPYFRIFNPVLQGEKFDPDGTYISRYIPELAHLPPPLLHQPWNSSEIVLGRDYPYPIVDHKVARERALKAFNSIKN